MQGRALALSRKTFSCPLTLKVGAVDAGSGADAEPQNFFRPITLKVGVVDAGSGADAEPQNFFRPLTLKVGVVDAGGHASLRWAPSVGGGSVDGALQLVAPEPIITNYELRITHYLLSHGMEAAPFFSSLSEETCTLFGAQINTISPTFLMSPLSA